MELTTLRLINKALKVSVNTVERDHIGYPVLLEAKDAVEKELSIVAPRDYKKEEAAAAQQNSEHNSGSGMKLDVHDIIKLVNEVYNRKCTQTTKHNIAVKTCRHTWPDETEKWCGSCYAKARLGR